MGFVVFSCVCMSTILIGPLLHLLSLPLFCQVVCLPLSPSFPLPPLPSPPSFSSSFFPMHQPQMIYRSRDLNSDLHDCVSSTWLRHRPSSKIGGYCCGWLACCSVCWLWVLECFPIKHIYERVWLLFPEHLHLFYLRQKYLSGLIP